VRGREGEGIGEGEKREGEGKERFPQLLNPIL